MNSSLTAFFEELALIKQAADFSKEDALRSVVMSDLKHGKAIGATPEQQYQEYLEMGGTPDEPKSDVPTRPNNKEMFKQLARNALVYGGGYGLGQGVGWLTAEKFLPKTFSGRSRGAIGVGAGLLTGLGAITAAEAMSRARRLEDERSQRNGK